MQKLQLFSVLSLTTSIAACLFSQNAASAQGFVKVKKDTLEQVQFYKAPRHIMILDENPRVSDHRRQINQENNILIAIPPLPSGKPGSTITLSPERNSLPQANFTSNIPAKGLLANQNLTPVRQGGLASADVLKAPANQQSTARPLMSKNSTTIKHSSPSQYAPAAYPEYTGGGASFSDGHTTTAVTGKLRQQLLQK
ncbi:MAG: hypothetical protein K2Y32_06890 [Candidatus Obscuribacterales bacterium]|nr:hypothetical protein [Candidatus Obscuribacterales bacterium]